MRARRGLPAMPREPVEAEEAAWEDPLVTMRMRLIEAYRKDNPVLGQYSPEQYLTEEGSMGDVFVSRFKRGMPFTNLAAKHIKPLLLNYWIDEIHRAAQERRMPELGGLLAYFEWLMANRGGWLAEMYVRTGIAGLAPPPERRSRWSRLNPFSRRR